MHINYNQSLEFVLLVKIVLKILFEQILENCCLTFYKIKFSFFFF